MNETQITFAGRVGGDITLREVSGDRHVASFRVATQPRRLRDGEWTSGPTTWHTVKAWNKLALHVAESLHSGDPVLVHGRLSVDVWERDGTSMTSYEVVATAVGHDLSHGTSAFAKHVRHESAGAQESPQIRSTATLAPAAGPDTTQAA
ncbi:single-stranded DNA-binding protein [Nocardioides seonyuensis]|nr:single-stranded DNA-binding protein [Nocardioides seonyuensis]